MTETPNSLFRQAAQCYLRAGQPQEAARCFRAAGDPGRAAQVWESVGATADAIIDYAAAGLVLRAAWLAVHELGDIETARDLLAAQGDATGDATGDDSVTAEGPVGQRTAGNLLRRLILARCLAAADFESDEALATLDDVMRYLEDHLASWDVPELEPWAVAVAQAMTRPDLVALVYAAAVRGGDAEAARHWDAWSRDFLEVPLQLPDPADDPARAAPADIAPA